ncbi:Transcription factor E [uncultured archaeon]|nr:Transcription factor E [uncultured archaeon]
MNNKKITRPKAKKTLKASKAPANPKVKSNRVAAVAKKSAVDRAAARKLAKMRDDAIKKTKKNEADAAVKREEGVLIEAIAEKKMFSDFISQNVGKRAIDIIKHIHNPQTDESVAADLGMKINEVRRILNVLSSYGVARYDTNKDNKGWLTFKWYLDSEKLTELDAKIASMKPESTYHLQDNCNDFFYCAKCYDEQKTILPFDAAFEGQFKCDSCGGKLKQLSRTEATDLFEKSTSDASE